MHDATASARSERFASGLVPFITAYFLVYAVFGLVRPGGGAFEVAADIAYLPFRIVATILMAFAARKSKDAAIARAWWLLATSQAFAVAGNLSWIAADAASTDVDDWVYLAWTLPCYSLEVAGFWAMMRASPAHRVRATDWVDAGVLMVAGTILAWYFLGSRIAHDQAGDRLAILLFLLDGGLNVTATLFAVAVWLRAPPGLVRGAAGRIAIALAMLSAADLVFEAQTTTGTYRNASFLDLWYAAAVILIALAADRQRRPPAGATVADRSRADRGDVIVYGAVVASLVPPIAEIARSDASRDTLSIASLGVILLAILMLWRQRIARREIDLLIANRVRLEHQLWQAQKLDAIGRLAGGIAHDFNNVLAAISAHAHLLRDAPTTNVAGEAAEIEFATERAAALVRRLLTFSRSDAPERKPVMVGNVVRSMQSMLRQLVTPAVTIAFELDDEDAAVSLADGQMEQVLLNLAINARDATPAGGRIVLFTRRATVRARSVLHRRGIAPGAWAVVAVQDTGMGMDAATQASIFQPFFTTKSGSGGTGLGLATVSGIVQAADGHILVESALGAGTTMTVYLPLATDPLPDPAERARRVASKTPTGTILIVDDELPIRSALARYLSRAGYRVIEAADVTQAFSQLEQHEWSVDLVLTDLRMPDASGLEMAERMRARRPTLPVLFMTGFTESHRGIEQMPPEHITIQKPFDLEVVAERVRAAIASVTT